MGRYNANQALQNESAAAYEDTPEAKREKALQEEMERQRDLMMSEALALLKKDRLAPDDITVTFLMRSLITSAFSENERVRTAAINNLLQIKGLKRQGAGRKDAEKRNEKDDPLSDMMRALRPDLDGPTHEQTG